MSISFDADVTISSTTPRDLVIDETANEVIIVESTGPTLRVFNMTTKSQRGSDTTVLSGVCAVGLVNSASAVAISSTGSTVDLIELSSLYRQNYSGSSTAYIAGISSTSSKPQMIAGNRSSQVAFCALNSTGNILKVTNSFPSPATSISVPFLSANSAKATTFITKGNTWLMGTDKGQIIEIDSSGTVLEQMQLDSLPSNSYAAETPVIWGLSYSDDMLLATTQAGYMYQISWGGKKVLNRQVIGDFSAARGTIICSAASGCTIIGQFLGQSLLNYVAEVSFTETPYKTNDILWTDSANPIANVAINSTTMKGAFIQQTTNKIRFFDIIPRLSTTLSSRIEEPASTVVSGRIIRIVDPGVGSAQVELDTLIENASTALRTSTGKNIIEIAMIKSGVHEKYGLSQYST